MLMGLVIGTGVLGLVVWAFLRRSLQPSQPEDPFASTSPGSSSRNRPQRVWSFRARRSRHPFPGAPHDDVPGRDASGDLASLQAHGLPVLTSPSEVADLLGVSPKTLRGWESLSHQKRPPKKGQHYHVRIIPKRSGGTRLLMVPKPRLKRAQRTLLRELLDKLPVHEAAHAFRTGRGPLTNASAHAGKRVVIGLDLKDFFPTLTRRRVAGFFRALGYGRDVSNTLAALTTTWAPQPGHDGQPKWPMLPQGAPTSPALANAICWRMDKRMDALAKKFGATYTRYADDLTFSGGEELHQRAPYFIRTVQEIIRTEGFAPNDKKTRVLGSGRQQRVTGLVVNEAPKVSRKERDELKAILHRAATKGVGAVELEPMPGDLQAHLRGRVAWVAQADARQAEKLERLWGRIDWGASGAPT